MSDGNVDARLLAAATDALTKAGGQWVTELASASGDGLEAAISNTIALASTDSVYDIELFDVDNDATPEDERDFVVSILHDDCAQGEPLECGSGSGNTCRRSPRDWTFRKRPEGTRSPRPPHQSDIAGQLALPCLEKLRDVFFASSRCHVRHAAEH